MRKLILLTILFYLGFKNGNAQPGELDASFGNNGLAKTDMGSIYPYNTEGKKILITPIGNSYFVIASADQILVTKKFPDGSTDLNYGKNGFSVSVDIKFADAILQPDGKIIIFGVFRTRDNSNVRIARINSDGSLDNAFHFKQDTVNNWFAYPSSAAIQPDGKIVVGGYTFNEGDFILHNKLIRYNPDGSVDKELDKHYKDYDEGYYSIAIQNDGKILVAGEMNKSSVLVRYNADLSLDSSFSYGGMKIFDFASILHSLTFQPNGKIIAGAYTHEGDFTLCRLHSDGILDSTFGSDGIQTTNFKDRNMASSIALQNDGKIVVAGVPFNNSSPVQVVRYNSNGSIDSSFDGDGIKITDYSIFSIAIQSDGKFLTLGTEITGESKTNIASGRYNTDGSPDSTFDKDGRLNDHLSQGNTTFKNIVIQSDKKIIAVGNTWNGANFDFAIARYDKEGNLDNTFSGDGKQKSGFKGGTNDYANSVAIQSDGKIIAGGTAGNNAAMIRYTARGSLDSTFDGDGLKIIDVGSPGFISKIIIQNDGKIITGGSTLARFNTEGSRDVNFNGSFISCSDIAILSDGKIVALGNGPYLTVAKYNADGSPDNTFGQNGIAVIKSNSSDYFYGKTMVIQPDGKIVAGGADNGRIGNWESHYLLLARINADGTRDVTFNGGKTVNTFIYYRESKGTSLKIQNDNKLILAGSARYIPDENNYDFALVRYNSDGTLDSSFSGDGIQLTRVSSANDEINGIILSDDKLYVAGYGQFPGNFGIVARYFLKDETRIPPTVSLTAPADNALYLSGGNVYLNAAASDADGTITKVEFYDGASLIYTATDTPYAFKWEHVRKGSYIVTAKATDNSGLVTTSVPVHISVVPNKPPSVNIFSPANNQTFLNGATIHLQAAAVDPDGRITKVEFYNGSILLATEQKLPYAFNWKIGQLGNYTITAKATDNWNAVTTSAAINVSVVPNKAPTVSIISPPNGQSFTAPATINFEAIARDPDGRIIKVSFYNGITLLTNEYKVPYTYGWQNVPAGTYTITAVATDNWTSKTTSLPLKITVTPAAASLVNSRPTTGDIKSGIREVPGIKLSPNPVTNILNIYTTGLQQKGKQATLSVISSSGEIMKTTRATSLTQGILLDVSLLRAGEYTLKVLCGDKTMYKKFIKI